MSVRPIAFGAAALAAALTVPFMQGTYAAGIPANKVAASGSDEVVLAGANDSLLLSETVKINNPTDLIVGVSLECGLITQVASGANGNTERAFGEVKIYVTIDGLRVPVADSAPTNPADPNADEVVFCNRAQEQQWTNAQNATDNDEEDELRQRQETRTANAFNWLALNVGTQYPGTSNNVHKIEVWADWDIQQTGEALADAYVWNRTLVLEPVKAAQGEVVELAG